MWSANSRIDWIKTVTRRKSEIASCGLFTVCTLKVTTRIEFTKCLWISISNDKTWTLPNECSAYDNEEAIPRDRCTTFHFRVSQLKNPLSALSEFSRDGEKENLKAFPERINDFYENGILLHFYLLLCSLKRDKIMSTIEPEAAAAAKTTTASSFYADF